MICHPTRFVISCTHGTSLDTSLFAYGGFPRALWICCVAFIENPWRFKENSSGASYSSCHLAIYPSITSLLIFLHVKSATFNGAIALFGVNKQDQPNILRLRFKYFDTERDVVYLAKVPSVPFFSLATQTHTHIQKIQTHKRLKSRRNMTQVMGFVRKFFFRDVDGAFCIDSCRVD